MKSIILLMQRTSTDVKEVFTYSTLSEYMAALVEEYEKTLEAINPPNSVLNYELQQLHQYVDELEEVIVLICPRLTTTYSMYNKTDIKKWLSLYVTERVCDGKITIGPSDQPNFNLNPNTWRRWHENIECCKTYEHIKNEMLNMLLVGPCSVNDPLSARKCLYEMKELLFSVLLEVQNFNASLDDLTFMSLTARLEWIRAKLETFETNGNENNDQTRRKFLLCLNSCAMALREKAIANKKLYVEALNIISKSAQ